MDRIEPYIGMPIVLGDGGMQTFDIPSAQTMAQPEASEPVSEMRTESADAARRMAQPEPMPPVRPVPLPENMDQQSAQSCLTDTNCSMNSNTPQQVMMPGMAYVPWQRWQQPYDYEKGFEVGTIFPDLDLPFLGYQGGRRR